MQSNQSRICAREHCASQFSSFFSSLISDLDFPDSFFPELGLYFLYFFRQETMITQRNKLCELYSTQIVRVPCARSSTVEPPFLHGKEFFDFFTQPIIFKCCKCLHGLIADKGEIAKVLLFFSNGFVVESHLQLPPTPLPGTGQVLVYFLLRCFREIGLSSFYLRFEFKQVLSSFLASLSGE